jgi:hypothetical protein
MVLPLLLLLAAAASCCCCRLLLFYLVEWLECFRQQSLVEVIVQTYL